MTDTPYMETLEPGARYPINGPHFSRDRLLHSQAISLKRIADHLEGKGDLAARCQELQEVATREIERRRAAEASLAEAQGPNGAELMGQFTVAVAETKGTMILDVDTHSDGTQHGHAVAVWDSVDEGGKVGD